MNPTTTTTTTTSSLTFNVATDFEDQLNEKIHLHLKARKGRKCLTIIDGLHFDSKEDTKKFIKVAQAKFATSGCLKSMVEYNDKADVFCFAGDRRYEFVELIKKEYGKDDNVFQVHGD